MSSQGAWTWLLDAYLRPERFLRARHAQALNSSKWAPRAVVEIFVLLITNFLTYALPVVVLWSAQTSMSPAGAMASLAFPFVYLTALTIWAFHAGLVLTGSERTLTDSVRSVVVAVSIYLGVGLGFAFPYLAASQTALARFLRNATMLTFTLNGVEAIRPPTQIELVLGLVGFGYYVLAVYLLGRIAYGASRKAAVFVTALAVGTPLVSAPFLYSSSLSGPALLVTGAVVAAVLGIAAPITVVRRLRFHS